MEWVNALSSIIIGGIEAGLGFILLPSSMDSHHLSLDWRRCDRCQVSIWYVQESLHRDEKITIIFRASRHSWNSRQVAPYRKMDSKRTIGP